jgi:hypothetical protein
MAYGYGTGVKNMKLEEHFIRKSREYVRRNEVSEYFFEKTSLMV